LWGTERIVDGDVKDFLYSHNFSTGSIIGLAFYPVDNEGINSRDKVKYCGCDAKCCHPCSMADQERLELYLYRKAKVCSGLL
jgi:hypothetical protein